MMVDHPRVPIFLLDSHEHYWPIAVESVEAVPAGLMVPPQGPISREWPEDQYREDGVVDLSALPAGGGRMNFPPGPLEQEQRLRDEFGGVGYRRELEDGGLTWIQYWLWYLYNPKTYVGIVGEHEGDWEFVQVAYEGQEPVCATVSQHHSGGRRNWHQVELREGRPVIYVGRDSHANFFLPVDEIQEVADDADGEGPTLDQLDWREFGDWGTWDGIWGNSLGKGRSPKSPGRQGNRWYEPRSYHRAAEAQ
jgi:hypothetical protein